MKTKNLILLIVIICLIIGLGCIFLIKYYSQPAINNEEGEGEICSDGVTYCTADTGTNCIALGCPEGTKYVGSSNSDKYYECNCGWAKNIQLENLVCFADEVDALREGRVESEC